MGELPDGYFYNKNKDQNKFEIIELKSKIQELNELLRNKQDEIDILETKNTDLLKENKKNMNKNIEYIKLTEQTCKENDLLKLKLINILDKIVNGEIKI